MERVDTKYVKIDGKDYCYYCGSECTTENNPFDDGVLCNCKLAKEIDKSRRELIEAKRLVCEKEVTLSDLTRQIKRSEK